MAGQHRHYDPASERCRRCQEQRRKQREQYRKEWEAMQREQQQ